MQQFAAVIFTAELVVSRELPAASARLMPSALSVTVLPLTSVTLMPAVSITIVFAETSLNVNPFSSIVIKDVATVLLHIGIHLYVAAE